MNCPQCGGEVVAAVSCPWGEPPRDRQRLAPFICTWCASVNVIDMATGRIYTPEELIAETGIDPIEQMKKNAGLWASIESARALILASRDCRPVTTKRSN